MRKKMLWRMKIRLWARQGEFDRLTRQGLDDAHLVECAMIEMARMISVSKAIEAIEND